MPTELINLSLPAHVRYDPDNMMIWMLIPSTMSANCQLKYFDYISKNELNPLAVTGIPGPDGLVRIKLFGAALDLKGKEKFYNQVIFKYFEFEFTIFATNTILYLLFFATNTFSYSLFLATPGVCHGLLFMQHVSGPFWQRPWGTNLRCLKAFVAGGPPTSTTEGYVPRPKFLFLQQRDKGSTQTENNTNVVQPTCPPSAPWRDALSGPERSPDARVDERLQIWEVQPAWVDAQPWQNMGLLT